MLTRDLAGGRRSGLSHRMPSSDQYEEYSAASSAYVQGPMVAWNGKPPVVLPQLWLVIQNFTFLGYRYFIFDWLEHIAAAWWYCSFSVAVSLHLHIAKFFSTGLAYVADYVPPISNIPFGYQPSANTATNDAKGRHSLYEERIEITPNALRQLWDVL